MDNFGLLVALQSVTSSGDIAVTEYFRKKVQIFSSSGRYLRQFGDTRDLTKNLKRPSSVAFRAEGGSNCY